MEPVTISRCAVDIDLLAAINLARNAHNLPASSINDDEGLVISTILAAAFGRHDALRPWRVTRRNGKTVTVIGNGKLEELRTALDTASPGAQATILEVRSAGSIQIEAGKRY